MKMPWQSKTIAFNSLAAIVVVANMFGYADFVPDAQVVTLVALVANLVLRYMTSEGLYPFWQGSPE
ncbi:MAG: hypothetical protein ACE5F6_17605 [Anaerolineae bacterium]